MSNGQDTAIKIFLCEAKHQKCNVMGSVGLCWSCTIHRTCLTINQEGVKLLDHVPAPSRSSEASHAVQHCPTVGLQLE